MDKYPPGVAVLDKENRIFSSWATVEISDNENEILSVESVSKLLKTMEERGPGGALIGVGHGRNGMQTPGRTLRQTVTKYKLEDGREVPAVWVIGQIHKHYPSDDQVWKDLEEGHFKGLSMGGRGKRESFDCGKSSCPTLLKASEGWEWTLAENPMNPLAKIVKNQFTNLNVIGFTESEASNIAKEVLESFQILEETQMGDEPINKEELMKEFAELVGKGLDEKLDPINKEIAELKTGLDEVRKAQAEPPAKVEEPVEKEEPEPEEPVCKACGGKTKKADDKKDDKDKDYMKKEDLDAFKKELLEDQKKLFGENLKKEVDAQLEDPAQGVESPSPAGIAQPISKEAVEGKPAGQPSEFKVPWEADTHY